MKAENLEATQTKRIVECILEQYWYKKTLIANVYRGEQEQQMFATNKFKNPVKPLPVHSTL